MKVDLFLTCLNDALFPKTGKAAVRVLRRLGHEVVFNELQTCCGQMHWNSGYPDLALPLVKRWVDLFRDSEAVVGIGASCVSMAREQFVRAAQRAGDAALASEVGELTPRVFEFSEFLTSRLGLEDVGATFPHTVTYHPTCHGARSLHVGDAPCRLLRAVKGLTLLDLKNADQCCGFGGTFSIKNRETSQAMVADKCKAVAETQAEYLVALDNSCLMHMRPGLRTAKPIHLAEILASTGEA